MSARTTFRPLVVSALLVAGWLVATASAASARVAPDPPLMLAPSGTAQLAVATTDSASVLPYLLVAAVACLVTLVVTLGSQLLRRRLQRRDTIGLAA